MRHASRSSMDTLARRDGGGRSAILHAVVRTRVLMRRFPAPGGALGTLECFGILDGFAAEQYQGSAAALVEEERIEGADKRSECERAERRIVEHAQRDTASVAAVPDPSHAVLHFG